MRSRIPGYARELDFNDEAQHMIVAIQCAGSKHVEAGCLQSQTGRRVIFVAHPEFTPRNDDCVYARPDGPSDTGLTWRESLLDYNRSSQNPFKLRSAFRLYRNPTYERLVDRFGLRNVYILSAGWGLIAADFLTPYYDITFSPSARPYQRRLRRDRFLDFCMVPSDTEEALVFLGGNDYLPLFCELTKTYRGKRTVFFNSIRVPQAPGCIGFNTTARTNWHYACANRFINGD